MQESTNLEEYYIALYVDDNLIVGKEEAISKVIQELKEKGFTLKVDEDLKDYLSCEIQFSENKKSAWLGQPHLIDNLQKSFGDRVKDMKNYKTPGTSNKIQLREKEMKASAF